MPFVSGTSIGPYEIISLIGAGGMGEVYRGRDSRLGRDVAIKVLPSSFAQDTDRLRRFEQEARATGLLNHPNILAVYDVGMNDGVPYLVSELLEGETLRDKLQEGPLSQRKAIEYAVQMTQGLSAAHEKGIVHRDLKPENIFITKDDRLKILDFGLAKLLLPKEASGDHSKLATIQKQTESGVVLGTVGYMSPEQVRGKQTDYRSDIFAFGAILYEMLTGNRPFRGDSAVETMNAILKEDPPDLSEAKPDLSPTLDHVVRRCLEKNPEMRFHSASDLGFALKELSAVSTRSTKLSAAPAEPTKKWKWGVIAGVAMASFLAAVFLIRVASRGASKSQDNMAAFSFRRLTFRRGNVLHARFAPDGKTVVYGASWEGQPSEIFVVSPGNPESRPLGIQKADLLSINSSGEMAILERRGILQSTTGTGTLAIASLTGGGAAREVLEDVFDADWLPDNVGLVVMRNINGKNRIEFPIGKTVFETADGIQAPRVSPAGDRVLFELYSSGSDSINLVDRAGNKTTIADNLNGLDIACWSHDGKSIWFTASLKDRYGIYSMDTQGQIQSFIPLVSHTIVHEISPDGTRLLEQELSQVGIRIQLARESKEKDLSWLDGSEIRAISADGNWIFFAENRQGGGRIGSIYVRKTDGSPAIKLGSGMEPFDISPDAKSVLVKLATSPKRLSIVPIGPGMPRQVSPENWDCRGGGFINQNTLGMYCTEPNQQPRIYHLDLTTLEAEALSPPTAMDGAIASEDGKQVLVRSNARFQIYPESSFQYPWLSALGDQDKVFLAWNKDGLFTWNYDEFPPKIFKIDSTGKRVVWKEIIPEDPTIIRIDYIAMTKDARTYAYQYVRILSSDLYLMTR
jgi:serine/threonine protein kinase